MVVDTELGASRQHLHEDCLDGFFDSLSAFVHRHAVSENDYLLEIGKVEPVEDMAQEVAEHSREEMLDRLQRRAGLSLLNDQGIDANALQMPGNDRENRVAHSLPVLRGVEIFETGALFNQVIFQLDQLSFRVERTLLGQAAEDEIPRAMGREVEVSPFIKEYVEETRLYGEAHVTSIRRIQKFAVVVSQSEGIGAGGDDLAA